MEVLIGLVVVGVAFLPLILSIVALVRAGRVHNLEASIMRLENELAMLSATIDRVSANPLAPPAAPPQRAPGPAVPQAEPMPRQPEPMVRPPEPLRPPEPALRAPEPAARPPTPAPIRIASVPSRAEATSPLADAPADDFRDLAPKKSRNLEEMLGGQLFLKAGVTIVVIGVVYFLAYALSQLGPLGKVVTGYAAGALMLGGGLFAERRERYRSFGRALVAGAWGILYFVTFAMHFVPAAMVIETPSVGAMLLLAAAACAVAFSLRYAHEWTTVASFLLISLSLGIAAWQTDTLFNLTATCAVAGALVVVTWAKDWQRLLLFGIAAVWVCNAIWVIRALAEAVPPTYPATPALASLVITWAVFGAAIVVPRRHTPREAVLIAAYFANLAGGFSLVMYHSNRIHPEQNWMVAAGFGLAYVLGAALLRSRARRVLYLVSATMGLAALAFVSPLRLGVGSAWVPLSRLLGIEVVLAAGVILRERYFRLIAYGAYLFTIAQIVLTKLNLDGIVVGSTVVHARLILLAAAGALSLFNVPLVRTRWRAALSQVEIPGVACGFSIIASGALLLLLWLELPDLWIAPSLAAAALLWSLVGRRIRADDWVLEATGLAFAAVLAATNYAPDQVAGSERALTLGGTLLALVLGYLAHRARRKEVPSTALVAAVAHSGLVLVALSLLVFLEAPKIYQAAALSAAALVYVLVATRARWSELLYVGTLAAAVAILAIAEVCWPMTHAVFGLPARSVSVLGALLPLYVAHRILDHFRMRAPEVPRALKLGDWRVFEWLSGAYLAVPTFIVCWLAKAELLVYDKNLLVALVWGALAVVYLEVARSIASRWWFYCGHALAAAAAVHLFLVNFLQGGTLGPLSLRVVTVVPAFALLLYIYKTWDGTAAPLRLASPWGVLRTAYFHTLVAVLGTLILYELPRSYVIAGWALLALLLAIGWRRAEAAAWRQAGLVVAIATVARGIGTNLYFRDEVLEVRLNLMAVPLACAALLGGYVLIRLHELRRREARPTTLRAVLLHHRVGWLASLVALVTAFIWVEAAGTILTVWLSIEGLALVALGFVMSERIGRLAGLLMLTACIVKLFAYDMRGLTGLPRIGSFIALGVVLIAVSYAYTRFRERLKELL